MQVIPKSLANVYLKPAIPTVLQPFFDAIRVWFKHRQADIDTFHTYIAQHLVHMEAYDAPNEGPAEALRLRTLSTLLTKQSLHRMLDPLWIWCPDHMTALQGIMNALDRVTHESARQPKPYTISHAFPRDSSKRTWLVIRIHTGDRSFAKIESVKTWMAQPDAPQHVMVMVATWPPGIPTCLKANGLYEIAEWYKLPLPHHVKGTMWETVFVDKLRKHENFKSGDMLTYQTISTQAEQCMIGRQYEVYQYYMQLALHSRLSDSATSTTSGAGTPPPVLRNHNYAQLSPDDEDDIVLVEPTSAVAAVAAERPPAMLAGAGAGAGAGLIGADAGVTA